MCIVNNCHGAVVGNDQLITRAGDGNGGRDRIDHGPRGHDDLVNAVRGVLAMHGAPTGPVVMPLTVRRPSPWRLESDEDPTVTVTTG